VERHVPSRLRVTINSAATPVTPNTAADETAAVPMDREGPE
jgi:hypothetical protein